MAEKEVKEETFEEVFDKAALEAEGKLVTETADDDKVAETSIKPEEVTKKAEEEAPKAEKPEEKGDIEQKYNTLQGMFKKMSEDFETYKKEISEKEVKESEKPKEVTPEPEEVDEELETYKKEYDLIAKNQSKLTERMLKKALFNLKSDIVKEISEKYDIPVKKVDALLESKLQEDYNNHLSGIYTAHEDYGKAFQRNDVNVWIETLTGTRKRVAKDIFENGETEEVIDLISEFKEAKGIKAVDSKNEDPNAKEKEEKEKADKEKAEKEKQDKLNSMEAVEGNKKTAIGGNLHKAEDFDSAFDEAAAKEEKKK